MWFGCLKDWGGLDFLNNVLFLLLAGKNKRKLWVVLWVLKKSDWCDGVSNKMDLRSSHLVEIGGLGSFYLWEPASVFLSSPYHSTHWGSFLGFLHDVFEVKGQSRLRNWLLADCVAPATEPNEGSFTENVNNQAVIPVSCAFF